MNYNTQSLSSYLYHLLDVNRDLIKIEPQTVLDISMNNNFNPINFDKYILNNPCMTKYINFLKQIYPVENYICKNDIINIIDKNIDEIVSLINNQHYIPILIINDNLPSKSNFFYTLYLLKKLQEKHININNAYFEIDHFFDAHKQHVADNKYLLLINDDIIYNSNIIIENSKLLQNYTLSNNNLKIYLNIVGYNLRVKTKHSSLFITFPANAKLLKSINENIFNILEKYKLSDEAMNNLTENEKKNLIARTIDVDLSNKILNILIKQNTIYTIKLDLSSNLKLRNIFDKLQNFSNSENNYLCIPKRVIQQQKSKMPQFFNKIYTNLTTNTKEIKMFRNYEIYIFNKENIRSFYIKISRFYNDIIGIKKNFEIIKTKGDINHLYNFIIKSNDEINLKYKITIININKEDSVNNKYKNSVINTFINNIINLFVNNEIYLKNINITTEDEKLLTKLDYSDSDYQNLLRKLKLDNIIITYLRIRKMFLINNFRLMLNYYSFKRKNENILRRFTDITDTVIKKYFYLRKLLIETGIITICSRKIMDKLNIFTKDGPNVILKPLNICIYKNDNCSVWCTCINCFYNKPWNLDLDFNPTDKISDIYRNYINKPQDGGTYYKKYLKYKKKYLLLKKS
jgi:hypothetical protein